MVVRERKFFYLQNYCDLPVSSGCRAKRHASTGHRGHRPSDRQSGPWVPLPPVVAGVPFHTPSERLAAVALLLAGPSWRHCRRALCARDQLRGHSFAQRGRSGIFTLDALRSPLSSTFDNVLAEHWLKIF